VRQGIRLTPNRAPEAGVHAREKGPKTGAILSIRHRENARTQSMGKDPSHHSHAQPRPKRARILLADDHSPILEGICQILHPHHEIVGMVTDGHALLHAAPRLKPDLIVLDISMPGISGIDAAIQLRKTGLEAKLVFLTMHTGPAYRDAALNAGGNGYVVKSSANEDLLEAIEIVLMGRTFISPAAR
jgi:CheY-like chemotaxis protein